MLHFVGTLLHVVGTVLHFVGTGANILFFVELHMLRRMGFSTNICTNTNI